MITLTQKATNIEKLLLTIDLHPIHRRKLQNSLWKLEDEIKNLANRIISGGSK